MEKIEEAIKDLNLHLNNVGDGFEKTLIERIENRNIDIEKTTSPILKIL